MDLSYAKPKNIVLFLFYLYVALIVLAGTFGPNPNRKGVQSQKNESSNGTIQNPKWYDMVAEEAKGRKIKIGLVNMHEEEEEEEDHKLHGLGETVLVGFDRVAEDQRWENYFPEWIDEDAKWSPPSCPKMPMPRFEDYGEVNVVIARVPCGSEVENTGVRDLFRLQVNLVVANLAVSGWKKHDVNQTVYIVFIGSCGPMLEIFRCEDLLSHEGDYWVYRPDLMRLKQKMLMPVGTCQLAAPYAEPGKEHWTTFASHSPSSKVNNSIDLQPKEAYVTILHSSEAYVCGAIALAQSIIQTKSTKDLVLLADDSITTRSREGLEAAGWKIKHIERIQNPNAEKDTYNEWNYSKLRVWQLTEYHKVIFIDADLLVLKNIDDFFVYPQLSAARNDKALFNSGIMLVEPSKCMFETLMKKKDTLVSYNGGDQGLLNEVFTWWHRLPSRLNYLKGYRGVYSKDHEVPNDANLIHYVGLKPWLCERGRDHDCNWDFSEYRPAASEPAHQRWWQVHDAMPERLQQYCALTKTMDPRLRKLGGPGQHHSLSL